MLQPWQFLQNYILCFICIIPLCCSLSISPQNIETSFPFPLPFHAPTINNTSDNLSTITRRPPSSPSPPSPLQEAVQLQSKPTSKNAVFLVVAVSISIALGGLLLFLFLIFFLLRCILANHEEEQDNISSQSGEGQALVNRTEFTRFNGNLNGFILQENDLDVIYWKNPNSNEERGFVKDGRRKPERVQENPLLHGNSSRKTETRDHSISSSQALPCLPPMPPMPKRKPPPPPPSSSSENDQTRLNPLHWDKVNTDVDHAMVWDKIDGGSFRFNGDLMEALFGYVATNKKSPTKQCAKHKETELTGSNNGGRVQISILDSTRSRNIAIILKSLNVSRQELLDALVEGHGLDSDTLEKLVKITPNQEEQSRILEFDGDPLKLGDAESFIFHLLKAVPTVFNRVNAMLFRSNFNSEINRVREFSRTLGVGCEELKRKGLLTKLLEATLKAENRLNSGTTRGDAQAFDLSSLLQLSDLKSTDGKTTSLHFVVEEVIRSEGKKRISNKNSNNHKSEEEREIEYGVSAVESLTSELCNVEKSARIDYETYVATCPILWISISEIRKLVSKDGGEYKRKMVEFAEAAEEELETASREQKMAMELVKKTNEYFGTGERDNPLELFVVVRDFVGMVKQVCNEIDGNLRRNSRIGSSDPWPPLKSSMSLRFPCLAEHFMCTSFSSDSEDDSS